MSAKKVKSESDQACHSWATIRRAQKKLGIVVRKSGFSSGWNWCLPSKLLKTTEDAHTKCVSNFNKIEHLRQNLSLPPEAQNNGSVTDLEHNSSREVVIV